MYSFGISNDWTFEDVMDKIGMMNINLRYSLIFPNKPFNVNNVHFGLIQLIWSCLFYYLSENQILSFPPYSMALYAWNNKENDFQAL